MSVTKPNIKPNSPNFSSGPCAKRPGWSIEALSDALTGRSHRSGPGKAKLKEVIDRHRDLLGVPDDYHIGIVPASDTGAFEMAMWSMLGARGVDVFAWEAFSGDWLKDITGQLGIEDVRTFEAEYGALPDLLAADKERDSVFVWNGTTSGVCAPNADWIADDREGLTFCDATSAVFAYDMDWNKLDVTTWSWQKVLGGEAAHGMIVLSPRAVERLESFTPSYGLPKIFRMTKGGKLNKGIFEGATINTPSMIAVEDCLDALKWVESVGGLKGTIARSKENFKAIESWAAKTDWVDFLAQDEDTRSTTSICLKIVDPWFTSQDDETQGAVIGALAKMLDSEGVAYDIKGYRDAPHGLRIWGGATIEAADLKALCPWLDWAYAQAKAQREESVAA